MEIRPLPKSRFQGAYYDFGFLFQESKASRVGQPVVAHNDFSCRRCGGFSFGKTRSPPTPLSIAEIYRHLSRSRNPPAYVDFGSSWNLLKENIPTAHDHRALTPQYSILVGEHHRDVTWCKLTPGGWSSACSPNQTAQVQIIRFLAYIRYFSVRPLPKSGGDCPEKESFRRLGYS